MATTTQEPTSPRQPAVEEELNKLQLKIGGMSCSFCTESIKKGVGRLEGVEDVSVSLAHEEALVRYRPALTTSQEIQQTIRALGYTIRDPEKVRSFEEEEAEIAHERRRLTIAGMFAAAAFAVMVAMWLDYMQPWYRWLMLALALGTVFGPGFYILRMAVASLRRGILNQHVLLEFGAVAGLAGGVTGVFHDSFPAPDFFGVAVFITTYHILSGFVSLQVRTRASQAVRKLMDLQPPTARVIRDGREVELPIAEVVVGDRVRIRPGEQIPVDGQVVEGASGVDESLVTGESIPAGKTAGDEVIGGSLNQTGTLLVEVTRVGPDSFIQQVARHVQEARALKPGIVQLVDAILTVYVPGVLAVAFSALTAWILLGWAFEGTPLVVRGIFAMLAALVMGYPCALGMATPLALIRGGGIAAQHGILMRSGEAFQIFKDVRRIVLDKTGTITRGEPRVTDVVPLHGTDRDELLRVAAAAEANSEHPLAQAIVDHAEDAGLDVPDATDFEAVAGKGVRATVDGHKMLVGSPHFLEDLGVPPGEATEWVEDLEERGRTVVGIARDGRLIGLIAIADTLKEDAAAAVARMKAAGMVPVMLTGDNRRTARAVAAAVGIEEVFAEVLPDQKAAKVRELQREGHRVAMVGDGINDAPALMQADVGIAIGAGTDIAIESSDVILIGKRLGGVVDAYHIGRSSYRKTVQNLSLAFAFNGIGVPAAATGLVHPVWAMIAMLASVSTVLLNSFGGRLLPTRERAPIEQSEAKVVPAQEPAVLVLTVPTIHCEGCVRGVKEALGRCHGVTDVDVEPAEKRVTVVYVPGQVSEAEIRDELAEAGQVVTDLHPLRQELWHVV